MPQAKAKGGFVNDNHRQWFGDSKVADKSGASLTVYHSTASDFGTFKNTKDLGFHFGSAAVANKRLADPSSAISHTARQHIVRARTTVREQAQNDGCLKGGLQAQRKGLQTLDVRRWLAVG